LLLIAENSTIVSHLYLESVTRREEGEYTCHPSMLGKPPEFTYALKGKIEIPVCVDQDLMFRAHTFTIGPRNGFAHIKIMTSRAI
jgi:hypothetical protein